MHDVVEIFGVLARNRLCSIGDLHLVVTPAPEDEILGSVEESQPGITFLRNFDIKSSIVRRFCRRMTAHLTGLHINVAQVDKLVGGVKLSIFEVETSAA